LQGRHFGSTCDHLVLPSPTTKSFQSFSKPWSITVKDLDNDNVSEIITHEPQQWTLDCNLCLACIDATAWNNIYHLSLPEGTLTPVNEQFPERYTELLKFYREQYAEFRRDEKNYGNACSSQDLNNQFKGLISRAEKLAGGWPKLNLATIQPRLNLTATALGKTANSSTLQLPPVPRNVGIDVTFKGYVPEESKSDFYTGYRYHWFIDGVRQSSEGAQLIQRLTPKDKPYNVVLKAEKIDNMRTANTTPPIYNQVMREVSIQVSILEMKNWDCKGRLGSGCNDGDIINKTITTQYTIVPCDNSICIKSYMSGGAIKHDRCCDDSHSLGFMCNVPLVEIAKVLSVGPLKGEECGSEWNQAMFDKLYQSVRGINPMFDHKWVYPPDGTDPPSTGIKDEWWKNIAPPGAIISFEEKEPDKRDHDICQSGKAEPLKTLIAAQDPVGGYSGSTPTTNIWICSEKTDLEWPKPLIKPQRNYPPIPYEDSGACPFEGCVYRKWIATKKTSIRKDRQTNSPIAFSINEGESVTAITGVVITTTPGEIKVLKPIKIGDVTASVGDFVYILTHLGEGVSKMWYKGNLGTPSLDDLDNLEFKKPSEYSWWVQVKNKKGQIGWTNQPENFSNKGLYE
jgi:hypothetical protein